MNWIMLIVAFFLPVVQPVVQQGAQHVQAQIQQQLQPKPQQQQPVVVYHNGEWWKWDGKQWWVWRQQP